MKKPENPNILEIKRVLSDNQLKPKQALGQNFLVDLTVLEKITRIANLQKKDHVLEVGPGLGVLSQALLPKVQKLTAVEMDKDLLKYLTNKLKSFNNFSLVHGDILEIDIGELNLPPDYKIVANIPYNITSKFLRKFLESNNRPQTMTLMVQKEVAQRVCAPPGKMSMLSLSVQFYAASEIAFTVSKKSFWPVPKIDSAVLQLRSLDPEINRSRLAKHGINEKDLFRIAKIGFSARRKQLHNNLHNGTQISNTHLQEMLQEITHNSLVRAQDLSVEQWISVAGKIKAHA